MPEPNSENWPRLRHVPGSGICVLHPPGMYDYTTARLGLKPDHPDLLPAANALLGLSTGIAVSFLPDRPQEEKEIARVHPAIAQHIMDLIHWRAQERNPYNIQPEPKSANDGATYYYWEKLRKYSTTWLETGIALHETLV